ncbi:MAG: M20/M25/M40 family metallo-hydrolase [Pirellulaceae bacterium]
MNHRNILSATRRTLLFATAALAVAFGFFTSAHAANRHEAAVARVGEDIRYMSSDELEGRGPGTEGLEKAAHYIRDRFQSLGLQGAGVDGTYMRPFEISVETKPDAEKTFLTLRGPEGQEIQLAMGEDYQALATGGSGKVNAEVVFAGYGITAPKMKYDDYQNADVVGKVVLILRHEPQQEDEESVFDGKRGTSHSFIRTKFQAARKNKAAAVLLVNDAHTTEKEGKDRLSASSAFGTGGAGVPFAHIKQAVADQILAKTPVVSGDKKLSRIAAIEAHIDRGLTPLTQSLKGWTADLEFTFETVKDDVSNVIGVIEGEGPLADETIVIGAHYDHLGYGPRGSRRPNEHAIHNGADDNATGTAAMMEIAKRFAERDKKPARRLVFIAFTAEERGLVGANHYLEKPLFPIENTVAMVNFDMIGNLKEDGVILGGVPTAREFPDLVERVADAGEFKFKTNNSVGGSDHASFYRKGIPVLFFFTGLTDLYHTPDDDFETINVDGAAQTIDFAERVLEQLVNMPTRPEYVKVARGGRGGATAYLGIVPDYNGTVKGATLSEIVADSPASKSGLKKGDVIVKFGDVKIASNQELLGALRKYKSGAEVEITVIRDTKPTMVKVKLGRP